MRNIANNIAVGLIGAIAGICISLLFAVVTVAAASLLADIGKDHGEFALGLVIAVLIFGGLGALFAIMKFNQE